MDDEYGDLVGDYCNVCGYDHATCVCFNDDVDDLGELDGVEADAAAEDAAEEILERLSDDDWAYREYGGVGDDEC